MKIPSQPWLGNDSLAIWITKRDDNTAQSVQNDDGRNPITEYERRNYSNHDNKVTKKDTAGTH